jgi:hypothetical protein
MHIQWKPIGPAGSAEVPCVKFIPAEKLGIVLKAKESFKLNDQEAALTALTGFRSPRIPFFTQKTLYEAYASPD